MYDYIYLSEVNNILLAMRHKVVPQLGGGVTFFLKMNLEWYFWNEDKGIHPLLWSHFKALFFLFNLTPKQNFSIDAN